MNGIPGIKSGYPGIDMIPHMNMAPAGEFPAVHSKPGFQQLHSWAENATGARASLQKKAGSRSFYHRLI